MTNVLDNWGLPILLAYLLNNSRLVVKRMYYWLRAELSLSLYSKTYYMAMYDLITEM